MFAQIRFVGLAICAIACVCMLAAPAAAQCPAKTTVADTLYNADGSLASGRVTIAWPTFVIGTCQVIAGQTTLMVTNGAFSAQLYPNTSAVPTGTSYRVTFALKSGRVTTEYWVVPASAVPVALAVVRSPSVPVPAMMFGEAQVTNLVSDLAKKIELPAPCPAGKMLESNGSSTPPQVNCVDPSSGSGSQHQVNGTNLASNSPVNFQNSSTIAFTNPGAGNVQASLADSAVTAAKLAVSNPSTAQLAGISDSNISAAALSPDRVIGTAVTQSRTISTTSPITGGGDLSANRTIACPTCVTSVSGTANEISSTGGATPTLSLPSTVDLSSKTLKSGTPLVLDGATADANKISVVVSDPTAAHSFTLPNADSVAVQPAACTGTDKVSAISSLGAITCSADQSGGGSTHNLLSATHPDTVASSPVLGDLLYGNASPAWDKLGGNTTTTKKYLSQTGTGAASAAPIWSQPSFSELSGSATAGQVPNLENQNGTLTPAKGGTGANNTATSGRYLRGDGTNFVSSSVAAAGAGGCTNQFVRAGNDNAAPTCATVAKADAAATFVHTDQSNTYSTGTQDFEASAVTRPFRRLAFASFPGSCTANREFLERSDPATAGQVIYVCNSGGNGWDLVGDGGAGGGISQLNGLTASVQSFATPGTSGTAPNWSSVTDTHTLNIPMASAASVTAGLISNTSYDTFNGKPSLVGAGTNGTAAVNSGDDTTAARSDHEHNVFMSLQWYFPGTPVAGVQTAHTLVPEGVAGCSLTNSRISVNAAASTSSTWNIKRCTTAAGDCTAVSNIYSSNVTLNSSAVSVAGGTPNTTTVSAGDAFKVDLVTVGTGLADVTVALSYKCKNTN